MKDWLTKLAQQDKSEAEILHDAVENLPNSVVQELVYDIDPTTRPTQLDDMQAKIASAVRMGQELAHEHGDELEKQAFLPVVAGLAARAVGGGVAKQGLKSLAGGVAKNIAKDTVINGATKAVTNAVRPPASMGGGPASTAPGGFNYGKYAGLNLAGVGRQAAGFFHRNPGAAVTLAGAGAGALMAPRDPETGKKQYVRGALIGGGLAAGANALSQGRIADKAKHMVTRQNNPIFGQGARRYMTESAYMTRPGAKATAQAASHAPAASAADAAAQRHVNDFVGGSAAMKEAPRARSQMERFQQGAQEHVEMGQLRNQMAPSKPLPAPQSAAFKAHKPSLFSRFSSPASVGGAGAAPTYQGGPVGGQVKVANDPKKLVYDPATKTFANVDQMKVAYLIASMREKRASLFSTKISPAAAGAAVRGGVAGRAAAGAVPTAARKPPPIPAAAASQPSAGQRAWQNSPFRAQPAKPAAPAGLAGVQQQLNTARSVAGGGPIGGGHATITALPGSGW